MEIVPISPEAIEKAVQVLKDGGVVMHATETCYGIACDLNNEEAVRKAFLIKERPLTQSMSALFSSIEEAKKYTEWNDKAQELAEKYLPGPLTMILKLKSDAPKKLFPAIEGNLETIGVRISSHPTAQALVEAFGSPISTTSANLHGKDNPYSAKDIEDQYAGKMMLPDVVLDDGQIEKVDASTIVDLSSGEMKILRAGPLNLSA